MSKTCKTDGQAMPEMTDLEREAKAEVGLYLCPRCIPGVEAHLAELVAAVELLENTSNSVVKTLKDERDANRVNIAALNAEVARLRGALTDLLVATTGTFCAAVERAKKLVGDVPPGIAVQVGAHLAIRRGTEEHDDIERLAAENERLREGLEWISAYDLGTDEPGGVFVNRARMVLAVPRGTEEHDDIGGEEPS